MPSLNVRLDDRAHEAFLDFSRVHGVSIAGLINAFGQELADTDDARPPAWARRIVSRGREVDADRRRRR